MENTDPEAALGISEDTPDAARTLPSSSTQQQLYLLDRLDPDRPVYNMPAAFRLRGRLDVEAFRRALNEVVCRHEPLRTRFRSLGEELEQIVSPPGAVELPMVDLRALEPGARATEVDRLIHVEARFCFPLEEEPLFRFTLIRTGAEEYVFTFVVHHIVSDNASSQIISSELASLYDSFARGESSPLAEVQLQYADFAYWEREWMRGEEYRQELRFWTDRLGGELPVVDLPGDRPCPSTRSFRGSRLPFALSHALTDSVKALSAREETTLFVTLLSAFNVLVYRYTARTDLPVGIPMVNRSQLGFERMVGDFVNMIVVRTELGGDPSFRELLRVVHERSFEAYAHARVPFAEVVRAVKPERRPGCNPLFQVCFNLQKPPLPIELAGIDVETIDVDNGTSKFDLTFSMWETGDGIEGGVEYSADLFEAETAARIVEHFRVLLEAVVSDAGLPISKLPLLSREEERRVLAGWNDTATGAPEEKTLVTLFERQVERTPDDVAVVAASGRVTYRELNRRANRLARRISERGGGPGCHVGCCAERTIDMVASLLGILKTGAAYVPLDPSYPGERLRFMVEDAGCSLLLTTSGLERLLPGSDSTRILIDRDPASPGGSEVAAPEIAIDSAHPAYVIYTSGSTGKPKGVVIPHRAVVNFLLSMARSPGLCSSDVLLSVTTLSFDISVLEIFLPLTVGAAVVLSSREDAVDGRRLIALMARHRITVMQGTPTTWRLLLEAGWRGQEKLKILCGGEPLAEDLATRLLDRCDELWNMYGPTETTVWSTTARIRKHGTVTIGRPIANTKVYILDRNLRPVPIGVPGELYIGGAGLALGYLDRPELTQERFVESPFDGTGETRLFRTGDLARFLPDGMIECLDRIDRQVKVRGFRIEMGEIEAVLARHPAVRQAVAMAREAHFPEDRRLVAYFVPADGQSVTSGELYRTLRASLPDYMVPSALVRIPRIPLTPSGKVDRKALPAPGTEHPDDRIDRSRPSDQLERRLVRLWEEQLGVEPIGVGDNFFELGGHSLLAQRVFVRIRDIVGRDLPLATLFQAPTIRELADLLRRDDWTPPWSSLVEIQPAGSRPPLFCVHGAGGNVLLYLDLARHLGPDQPVYGLQSPGLDGDEPFLTSIEEMATRYVREVRAIQPDGPYRLGGYCLGGTIAFEMAQQLRREGQEVCFLALLETYITRSRSPATFGYRLRQFAENVSFHARNLLLLGTREKEAFLAAKGKVGLRRLRRRVGAQWAWIAGRQSASRARLAAVHLRLKRANDQAQARYSPETYPGKIDLFRPDKNFSGLEDREFGWGELARGGIDVHRFPIYPRAMLSEPFVQRLAERLGQCLDEAK